MKKNFSILLVVYLLVINLTGCGYSFIKQNSAGIMFQSMCFSTSIIIATDSKVLSQRTDDESIEIIFENGITFKTIMHNIAEENTEFSIECIFEGPKDIIEYKMADYTKICLSNNLDPEQIKDILLTTGQYEIKIDGTLYSAKYTEGRLSFSSKRDKKEGDF